LYHQNKDLPLGTDQSRETNIKVVTGQRYCAAYNLHLSNNTLSFWEQTWLQRKKFFLWIPQYLEPALLYRAKYKQGIETRNSLALQNIWRRPKLGTRQARKIIVMRRLSYIQWISIVTIISRRAMRHRRQYLTDHQRPWDTEFKLGDLDIFLHWAKWY
jgi:hypothetical protein